MLNNLVLIDRSIHILRPLGEGHGGTAVRTTERTSPTAEVVLAILTDTLQHPCTQYQGTPLRYLREKLLGCSEYAKTLLYFLDRLSAPILN